MVSFTPCVNYLTGSSLLLMRCGWPLGPRPERHSVPDPVFLNAHALLGRRQGRYLLLGSIFQIVGFNFFDWLRLGFGIYGGAGV